MNKTMPNKQKIYHVLHMDRLSSVLKDGSLFSDQQMAKRPNSGTTIGMGEIKCRRLEEITVSCYENLFVGECVPFYFCPRSIMLYLMFKNNHPELIYDGGQEPIIHLEADMDNVLKWAEDNNIRWAFSLINAGTRYAEFRNTREALSEINWDAVHTDNWQKVQEEKQAEFLVENAFPIDLVERIGVFSKNIANNVKGILDADSCNIPIEVMRTWYY